MNNLVLIKAPAVEPITLADAKLQLGFSPWEDSDHVKGRILADVLRPFIRAARRDCETYTRRVFMTQTWLLKMDGFPGADFNYNYNGYPAIYIPQPPLQSIEFLNYVDVSGVMQTLEIDLTYGVNPAAQYGYQLTPGSETQLARVLPPFARPWPPQRMVPENTLLQFKCGYGGPVTVSMTLGSAILSGPVWNPGDVGQALSIPGAGVGGVALETTLASVDANGQGTAGAAAATAVTNVTAYAGQAVPDEILTAIKMRVEYYYELKDWTPQQAAKQEQAIYSILKPYRNLVA